MDFSLQSDFKPTGDQPRAIQELIAGVEDNIPFQTLLLEKKKNLLLYHLL